jgi:hypothetical protein
MRPSPSSAPTPTTIGSLSCGWLTCWLRRAGIGEAITVLRPHADAGDGHDVNRMAYLLTKAGRVDEAIAILRAHDEADGQFVASWLAHLLGRARRVDEAIAVIRPAPRPATRTPRTG